MKRTFLLCLLIAFFAILPDYLPPDIQLPEAVDPELRVEIGPALSFVELENSQVLVRYEPFVENHAQFAIRQFVMKRQNDLDQAGAYLDADAYRGTLQSAVLVQDGQDIKTVRLRWNNRENNGTLVQEVSIYANRAFLKIDYVDVSRGINLVDLGVPGGEEQGTHVAYGGDLWIRPYVTYDYAPTMGSYYNRYPPDGVNDPANGGVLNYHGHFIIGVYDQDSQIGYGRALPVQSIPIIKLLLANNTRRGFEFFHFGANSGAFTSYLYPVVGGADEIVHRGQQLVDGISEGIAVNPTSGLITNEQGGSAEFTMQLESQPFADVTIQLESSDLTEGTVSPGSLTFTPDNWLIPQTVKLTGVDDDQVDGHVDYTIITSPASSADPTYAGLDPPDVLATNRDDDLLPDEVILLPLVIYRR